MFNFGKQVLTVLPKILLNRYLFLAAISIVAVYSAMLNFNGKAMYGLIPAYERFGDFFTSGLDFESTVGKQISTIPIWGYGILFFFTKSKTALIILQLLFSVVVLMGIDYALEKLEWKKISRILFRLLVCSAWIWFYFHTILWPYSWGANLLLVSLFAMIFYLRTSHLRYLVASGIAFGVMLNFRSDYLYFAIGMVLILLLLNLVKQLKFTTWHLAVWVGLILLALAPWGWYSYQKTGHFLLKSTNGGHVLFISLGQLPDNKWGITPLDADPKMRQLIDENVGPGISTLSYAADTFLTAKWVELIREDPAEFVNKSKQNLNTLIETPFYNGEVLGPSGAHANRYLVNSTDSAVQSFVNNMASDAIKVTRIGGVSYRLFLFHSSIFRWVFAGLLLFMILHWRNALSDPVFVVLFPIVGYQIAVITFAFYLTGYNSNLIVVYSILAVYFFVEKLVIPVWARSFVKKGRIWIITFLVELNEKLIFNRRLIRHYRIKFKEPIRCVVDVGANTGQSIDLFLQLNSQCRVIAFKPSTPSHYPQKYEFP